MLLFASTQTLSRVVLFGQLERLTVRTSVDVCQPSEKNTEIYLMLINISEFKHFLAMVYLILFLFQMSELQYILPERREHGVWCHRVHI